MSSLPFATVKSMLRESLRNIYNEDECTHIAKSIFSKITRQNYVEIHQYDTQYKIKGEGIQLLTNYIKQLQNHLPLQYVIEEAHFDEHIFYVNKDVLIPREETSKIIALASAYINESQKPLKCIDLCTGSGCIAISLQKRYPSLQTSAIDLSAAALSVAKKNEKRLDCKQIQWHHSSIEKFNPRETFDIIVSNPPYIAPEEYQTLDTWVKQEPKLALIEPADKPLYFYNVIAKWGEQYLNPNGLLIVEIHESKGEEVIEIFEKTTALCHILLKQDFLGKDRFLLAHANKN